MRSSALSLHAQDATRQIALVRPQMHQRLFAFAIYFTLQRGEFGEPLAVFANLHAAGRREIAQRAIECRPILRRRVHSTPPVLTLGN